MKRFASLLLAAFLALVPMMGLKKAAALGPNLIANPSFEATTGTTPTGWTTNKYGTNRPTFTYETTGRTGSRSASITMASRTSGDAKWIPTAVTVSPNTSYTFSDWYKSTVKTSIDAAITSTTGKVTYKWLGDPAASSAWKQNTYAFTTPADAAKVTIFHSIGLNGTLTVDDYMFAQTNGTTPTPTPPAVQMSSPANNATISGTQTVAANASDAQGIQSVQFKLNGANLGAADTTAPYSVSWDTKTIADGSHTLSAVATNTANLTTTAPAITVQVKNAVPTPTPPTVQITAPTPGATVNGIQTIAAAASDAQGIRSVQFRVDGVNFGAADTTAPYSVEWDTTKLVNGTHTVSAVATNVVDLTATSANVAVTVNNVVVTPPPVGNNVIANPSVETADASGKPQGWVSNSWGTNTSQFSYVNTGRTGSKSLRADVTAYTSGDAKWYFANTPVTPGTTYLYNDWYQSDVDTEVDAAVTMADGTVQYYYLATASASTAWAKVSAQFTAPVNAKSITIFHVIAKKGYLVTDDFSLAEYTPSGLNRALVSLTFDDGWRSQYTHALPIMNKYGMKASFYMLTSTVDYPDYMTVQMMQALKDQGHEIDSHTISHPHLPQLTPAQLTQELSQSQSQLRQWFGPSVADDIASPYGEYSPTTINEIKKYYRSHRSTDVGFNSKDTFDIYNIKVQNILYTTPASQVAAWVDQAQRDRTWLVLVYHEVATAVEDPTYSISPADFDAQLAAIQSKGIAVVTLEQALNEITTQL